jgi:hypothetical protein
VPASLNARAWTRQSPNPRGSCRAEGLSTREGSAKVSIARAYWILTVALYLVLPASAASAGTLHRATPVCDWVRVDMAAQLPCPRASPAVAGVGKH